MAVVVLNKARLANYIASVQENALDDNEELIPPEEWAARIIEHRNNVQDTALQSLLELEEEA